jgi:hypothetical protein
MGAVEAFAKEVLASRKFETWKLTQIELLDALRSRPIVDFTDAVARVFEAFAHQRGKTITYWGDKNNYYVSKVPELLDLFPHAHYLHIVRDPRDVACSYKELTERAIDSVYRPVLQEGISDIGREWASNNQHVLDLLEGHPGYFRLRYEDLVTNVEGTMAQVLDKLGLEHGALVSGDMHLQALDEPTEFLQWKSKLTGPVDSSSVGRYVSGLSVADQRAVIEQAGQLMSMFGYV